VAEDKSDPTMAERKPFLLRLDSEVLAALQRWAADDLRSLNGQLEFVLRAALRDAGRFPAARCEPRRSADENRTGETA
jgi:hypothetical protein